MKVTLAPILCAAMVSFSMIGITAQVRADNYLQCLSDCKDRHGCGALGARDAFSCSSASSECTRECLLANEHGAIAYSPGTGNSGVSAHWDSEEKASDEALKYCGRYADDCTVEVTFQNECGAIAVGANGKRGWGRDYVERNARAYAIEGCVEDGGRDCKVEVSHCSKY